MGRRKSGLSADEREALESALGHRFDAVDELCRALTHSSQAKGAGPGAHYERLEFVGDRVLGLCVADMLYAAFPNAPEGELSVRFNSLVSGETCTEVCDDIGLHRFIRVGADIKQVTSKRMRSVRADVVESVIAAIYRDGGLEAARSFVERHWRERLEAKGAAVADSKTALQEWAHAAHATTPAYNVIGRDGPDHAPRFTVEVTVGAKVKASGEGSSKREAEQMAAQRVLVSNGVWEERDDGSIREVDA